jgi:hypothetical protein
MYQQDYPQQNDSDIMKGDYQSGNENTQESGDLKVLNEIYQNAAMGKQSISNIITKIENEDFKKKVLNAYQNYEEICGKCSMEIMNMGERPKEKNPFSKAMLWGMVNASAIVDDSVSNLAGIIIKGCNNSKNNITRTLNQAESVSQNVKDLADEYLKNEQQCISDMQSFL